LDRFGEVGGGKVGRVGKVGDGAGDFERTIVGPGAETKFGYGYLQELLPFRVDLTELPDIADTYLGIGENYSAPESFALPFARRLDPAFDRRRQIGISPDARESRPENSSSRLTRGHDQFVFMEQNDAFFMSQFQHGRRETALRKETVTFGSIPAVPIHQIGFPS